MGPPGDAARDDGVSDVARRRVILGLFGQPDPPNDGGRADVARRNDPGAGCGSMTMADRDGRCGGDTA
jgi:hypothetical protein